MSAQAPQPIHRKDYRPPDYRIEDVDLRFELDETNTRVTSRLGIVRNGVANGAGRPLVLLGDAMGLERVRLDGVELDQGAYSVEGSSLTIPGVSERFELETVVRIDPKANTALSGLYLSSGNFCTQCEAEGFRRITYFLDRPDVMAKYRVRIEADKGRYPVLLSNGNRVESGDLPDARHWVQWEDPFKKPSYLFALVAGNLRCLRGSFTTCSGREIDLEIWVEPQNIESCEHALESLKKAMRWDEETFGREYDLDLYMIVAVNDFNMGAMENKGLNVFNSKYVLARPETATDDDYENILGVIGHEYFHNWTGNRVTCRDWFQLTLKEGLTVFRDQCFSADMTSAPVKRIQDVRGLRSMQFAEDAGPMAHPIRPEAYIEMNNFYTSTVYEKGAEVVRMYQTLLGKDGFRKGLDLYFERHDGQAVTCDDFRAAMADANGRDLTQFERWYSQAGTPRLHARGEYDAAAGRFTLALRQDLPEVAGQTDPQPLHIPVSAGLLGSNGRDMAIGNNGAPKVLELTKEEQSFGFEGLSEKPVVSLLRDFSAPVRLVMERSTEELAFLMAHDQDPFQRWDAGQELAKRTLLGLAADRSGGKELKLESSFVDAFRRVLVDDGLDGSLKALALTLPGERVLGQEMEVIDVDAIHAAREFTARRLAESLRAEWERVYDASAPSGAYAIDKHSIDRRRLRNTALAYLSRLEESETTALALGQFQASDNMTEVEGALICLAAIDCSESEQALRAFYDKWKQDPLVTDKWFRIQALSPSPTTFERVRGLAAHEAFSLRNPNRARSLLGAFSLNQVRFHRADGAAYAFLADNVLELDALNPQVASRVISAFNPWKRFDAVRQSKMKAQLSRIVAHEGLSKDVFEIASKALA